MDTKKVIFLLLTYILVSSGQGKGSKSRFDDILSQFGFGANPVALEQQTQGPHIAHAINVRPVTNFEPLQKDAVKHKKKQFTDALSKFGFGVPDSNVRKEPKSHKITKSKETDIKKYEHLIKPTRKDAKNKFKEALKQFGFSNAQATTFPQGIGSPKVFNQPQLVQVVTSTFSPTHQILPRDSKRQTSQIPNKPVPKFTRERHSDKRKNTGKTGKPIKKNFNKIPKIKHPSKSKEEYDPTIFVTPKNGKKSKGQDTAELKKTSSRQNNPRSHAEQKHSDQSHVEPAFSDASFSTETPVLVTPKHIPVDFGEKQLSTQRPRHSRKQDLEDKTNALAALFNVAGGSNKATKEQSKPVHKKKLKVKKPTQLNENNILRQGLRQSSRGNVPVKTTKPDTRRPQNKQSRGNIVVTTSRTTFGRKEQKRNQNKSNDPLVSLFSLVKDEGQRKGNRKLPKGTTRGNIPSRKSNIPVSSTQRSQSRKTPRFSQTNRNSNILVASNQRTQSRKAPAINKPIPVATTQGSQNRPTPRRNNASSSTRRGNRPPTNLDRESVRGGAKKEKGTSSNQNISKQQFKSATRQPSIQVKPSPTLVGSSKSPQSFSSTQRSSPQTQSTRIEITSQKSKTKNNGLGTQTKKQETRSKSNSNSILNKFGFSSESTELEQQKLTKSAPSKNVVFSTKATQPRKTNDLNNNIDSSTRPIQIKTTKPGSIVSGISIISKSGGFSPTSKQENEHENSSRPSTTPFTIFRSPSTRAPSQVRETDEPKPATQRSSVRNSPTSRGSSLGRGRGSASGTSNVPTSQFVRTTQSFRGRGDSPGSTPRTGTPRRIVSSRQPSRQNPVPSNKSSAGSNVLDNLLQIAGNAANNPVVTATPSTLPSNIPDRRVNVPLERNPSLNSISNPFIQQTREVPVQVSNIRINANLRGRTVSRQPVKESNDENNPVERNRNRFQAEQDRIKPSTSGRVSGSELGSDVTVLRNVVETVQPKRNQLPPRRPSIIIDDPEFNSIDDDDRRTSIAFRQREKSEERRRPTKSKHKSSLNSSKVRPPVSAGCFHICDTLIFEVYKLLGGGICDC